MTLHKLPFTPHIPAITAYAGEYHHPAVIRRHSPELLVALDALSSAAARVCRLGRLAGMTPEERDVFVAIQGHATATGDMVAARVQS